ncbi:hypothetical protein [Streptomyces sp. NPDC004976]
MSTGLPGFDEGHALMRLNDSLPADRRELPAHPGVRLPYADAARVVRCPVGTIRSRVSRARLNLIETAADELATVRRFDAAVT